MHSGHDASVVVETSHSHGRLAIAVVLIWAQVIYKLFLDEGRRQRGGEPLGVIPGPAFSVPPSILEVDQHRSRSALL